ncbi:hypothetical protein CDD83_7851 [Cordyceps sp. RAO-2017]|nr:hypothetical protein CDD83_7851 [Cordyceps sp. RAO-2017]
MGLTMDHTSVPKLLLVLAVALLCHRYFRKQAGPKLPPGPKPLPLLGNIRDLPPKGVPEYKHWLKHKALFGPISSVTVLGQTVIILHDRRAVQDLLVNIKSAKKTSNRPRSEFALGLCGFDRFAVGRQPDEEWKTLRKLMHQQIGSKSALSRYHDVMEEETGRFLQRILREPQNVPKLFKTVNSAIVLKITYGYAIEQEKADPLVELVEKMMNNFSNAFVPAAWLVDILPLLKYIPSGLPGTKFKQTAREWDRVNEELAEVPFSFARSQMDKADHTPSLVTRLLQEKHGTSYAEDAIKYSAASIYSGGSDTLASSLASALLAMAMYPEVQRKAQAEIDRVVGQDRLPSFHDREKMPYLDALISETLRWLPVGPMGPAHAMVEDTVYNGYLFPKGAVLVSAIWWFTHDPDVYRDPDTFEPERYLEPRNEPDPRLLVFGHGRRECPGRQFVDETLFLIIAQLLAVYKVGKAVGKDGSEIEVKLEPIPGLVAYPADFPYSITPRSAQKMEMLRGLEAKYPWGGSDSGLLRSHRALL